jgi:hypothetical protein
MAGTRKRDDRLSLTMVAMGGMRTVVGAVVVTALLAACTAPADEVTEADTAPSTPATSPSGSAEPTPSEREKRVSRGGARGEVPEAVIMQQLARVAERIARRTPVRKPPPADIDPGTNRALGYQLLLDFGFPAAQWKYLDALWHRESGWNHLAENPSSGAYGIPQSLPATKMAVVGPDWRTNPETQIRWGLAYIAARYGSPEGAWAHSERVGWY